jgi:hypothetical protein
MAFSTLYQYFQKNNQNYAFKKATLIHAWGPVMTISMVEAKVDLNKVLVPKELTAAIQ